MNVKIMLDDQDHHGEGCECGDCNANGKAYGAGIYEVLPEQPTEIDMNQFLERCYAPSEEGALARAKEFAERTGWVVV